MKIKTYWEAKPDLQALATEDWKSIYQENIACLTPNKKSAADVLAYVRSKYQAEEEPLERVRMVVEINALGRRPYLPEGVFDGPPEIVVLHITNYGAGEELYKNQEEDFWRLGEEKRIARDIEYIPQDEFPVPVFVGAEMRSGYVYVEGSPRLADELFAYQGLSERELQNEYLVAQYVKLLKKPQSG